MNKTFSLSAVKTVLPFVLGFLGGLVSTIYPAYFSAFCSGSIL